MVAADGSQTLSQLTTSLSFTLIKNNVHDKKQEAVFSNHATARAECNFFVHGHLLHWAAD